MSNTLANHTIKITLEAQNNASGELQKTKRDLDNATQSGKENSGVNRTVSGSFKAMGTAIGNTGGKMKDYAGKHRALAVGVAAGSVKMITSSNDYNKTLAQTVMISDDVELKAMSQDEAMAHLNGTVDTMRQTYKTFSKQQIADEFYEIAKSGYSGADATDILNASLALATATGEDASAMTDVMISALTSFGLEAGDAGDSAQYLANAANASRMDVSDMLTALNLVGAVAKDAGLSLEDTANYMGYLRQNGMSASTASTGLRQTLMNLTAPTEAIQGRFDELGVALHDSEGNFRGVETVMGEYRTATEGASDSVKDMDAKLIAGKTGAVAWKTLIDDASGGVEGFAQAVKDGEVPLDQMVETMNNEDPWGVFKANLSDTAVNLGQTLAPVLLDVLEAVNDFLQRINEDEEFRNHVAQIMKVVGAFAVFTQVVGVIGIVLGALGTVFQVIGGVISFFGTIVSAIGTVLAFLATPVGIVIGVITALGAIFTYAYNTSEEFRDKVNSAVGAVKDFVQPAVDFMADKFGFLAEKFAWVADIFTAVKEVMKGVWDSITGLFKKGKKDSSKEMDDMGKNAKNSTDKMKVDVENNTGAMQEAVSQDMANANKDVGREMASMSDTVDKETGKAKSASKSNTGDMTADMSKSMIKSEKDIKQSTENITKTITKGTDNWKTSMAKGMNGMSSVAVKSMDQIRSKVVSGMNGSTKAVSSGSNDMNRTWAQGISQMGNSTSVLSGMVSSIYSMTRVDLYNNGRNAMISFGNGLMSGLNHVYNAVQSASNASSNMSEMGYYTVPYDSDDSMLSTMGVTPVSSAVDSITRSLTGDGVKNKNKSSLDEEDSTIVNLTIVQEWDGESVRTYIKDQDMLENFNVRSIRKGD